MANIHNRDSRRWMEERVQRTRLTKYRPPGARPTIGPLTIASMLACAGVTMFGFSRAVSLDMSGVSATSVMDGALEAGLSVVGGNAFIVKESTSPAVASRPLETAPPPSPSPAPIDLKTLTGSPYSATSAVNAWSAAGFTVTQRPLPDGFRAVSGNAVGLRLSAPGGELTLALIVYDSPDAVQSDWQTSAGQRPQPKAGSPIPTLETAWWNSNVIAAVLTRSGSPPSAFDAFFRMR
jgi:hypothetical protein